MIKYLFVLILLASCGQDDSKDSSNDNIVGNFSLDCTKGEKGYITAKMINSEDVSTVSVDYFLYNGYCKHTPNKTITKTRSYTREGNVIKLTYKSILLKFNTETDVFGANMDKYLGFDNWEKDTPKDVTCMKGFSCEGRTKTINYDGNLETLYKE